MKLNVPYKFLNINPEEELLNFDFSTLTADRWSTDLSKKLPDIFGEMCSFRIMLFHMNKWSDPLAYEPEFCNSDHPIYSFIINEIKKLELLYNASAKIAVIDGMPAGSIIARHQDGSGIFQKAHRVHLPLVTHEDVKFIIDDIEYHFPSGKYYEFDNSRFHEVHNNSDIFRLHLVVDLIPNNINTI
jgi:aspartyl/asparaginyl beta-hydroxylase (cupin superfamily)